MTTAVTQVAIEDALIERFQGLSISVEGVQTPVTVFLEDPLVEEVSERTYPAITLMYLGESPDFDIRDSDDDEGEMEEVSYTQVPPVYLREMRAIPQALQLNYSIDTWNKTRAQQSRDLLSLAVRGRIRHRGYLRVKNILNQDVDLWMFWDGGVAPLNEKHPDMIVYHSSLTVRILAYVAVVEVDDTVEESVAMSVGWEIFSKKVDEPAGNQLDIAFEIDEDGVSPV